MGDSSLYNEKNAIPHGKDTGGQEGRLDPGRRVYKGNYEAVSLEEASRRAQMRQKGSLEIIKGGIDDNDESLLSDNVKKDLEREKKILSSEAPSSFDDYENFSDSVVGSSKKKKPRKQKNVETVVEKVVERVVEKKNPYFDKKIEISVELNDISIALPALGIHDSEFCTTIVFNRDTMHFVPKPGSEFTVTSSDGVLTGKKYYFPGSMFDIKELGILGLCLIKAE